MILCIVDNGLLNIAVIFREIFSFVANGDHIDIIDAGDESTVVVLADGLGSGVKASILSTLTSKIIATMTSEGIALEECVRTIAATLALSQPKLSDIPTPA